MEIHVCVHTPLSHLMNKVAVVKALTWYRLGDLHSPCMQCYSVCMDLYS